MYTLVYVQPIVEIEAARCLEAGHSDWVLLMPCIFASVEQRTTADSLSSQTFLYIS